MIYTDKIHLITDSLDELHYFANKIRLKKDWFQNHKRHPHYDIWGTMYMKAIANGAIIISSKNLIVKINEIQKRASIS